MGNCPSVKQRPICEAALRRPLVTNEAIEDKSQAQPEDFNVLLLGMCRMPSLLYGPVSGGYIAHKRTRVIE